MSQGAKPRGTLPRLGDTPWRLPAEGVVKAMGVETIGEALGENLELINATGRFVSDVELVSASPS